MRGSRRVALSTVIALTGIFVSPATAMAIGEGGTEGGTDNHRNISASAMHSRIKIRYVKGGDSGNTGGLSPVDTDWEPPACWYEPVFSPKELQNFVDETGGVGDVGIHETWVGKDLWTDHYKDGKPADNFDDATSTAKGYKDYNLDKDGYFWRSVAPDPHDPESWDCGRIMFWQPDSQVPDVPNAPNPKMLSSYAYNKVKVPKTAIELNPRVKSTVNLATWVWLDKARFHDVLVRAELPRAGLWAETTATPVSLHLDPGSQDAQTYPASGTCKFNKDGSIGSPYKKGDSDKTPPCGVTYLRASEGQPYELKASITWKITWQGSGGTGGKLPSGTFDTTQAIPVQEIQSIVR